ncbi:MAG: HAD family hydrolase, partial [Proteobacteria bacterium]|nr:HAD family hydrolase [Pseudomonadota bacterium]
EDIGLPQQMELFEQLSHHGNPPPVIDAGDFLHAPEAYLRELCAHFAIPFIERMLHWPPGPRASDGPWAPHWYGQVWQSTGFDPPRPAAPIELSAPGEAVVAACRPHYDALHARRLRV